MLQRNVNNNPMISEGFVERVIERPHAKHHAERCTPNLPDDALFDDEA
jgi:hypothetical protein